MQVAVYDNTGVLLGIRKSIYDIITELKALTNTQITNIWNNLNAGSPPLIALDDGNNAAAIWTMHFVATGIGSLTQAEKNESRYRLIAFYVQDNPTYLDQPAFDPSIQILGYTPAV